MTAHKHNSPAGMDEFYRTAPPSYHADRAGFYSTVAEACARATTGKPDMDVLEVGCGAGHQIKQLNLWFGARIAHMTGIDISGVALSMAAENVPGVTLVRMDIVRPRADWAFDLILASQVLEHVLQAELALESMVSMLKPGGVLLLTVPDGALDSYGGHHHFWTLEEWAELLRQVRRDGYAVDQGSSDGRGA